MRFLLDFIDNAWACQLYNEQWTIPESIIDVERIIFQSFMAIVNEAHDSIIENYWNSSRLGFTQLH